MPTFTAIGPFVGDGNDTGGGRFDEFFHESRWIWHVFYHLTADNKIIFFGNRKLQKVRLHKVDLIGMIFLRISVYDFVRSNTNSMLACRPYCMARK